MLGKRNDSVENTNRILANFTTNKTVNQRGIYGGFFVGYMLKICSFGIGPEFFYNYGSIENTVSNTHKDQGAGINTAFDIKHRITTQSGINARIGCFLESYFLYMLFGQHFQTGNYKVLARQEPGGALVEFSHDSKNKVNRGASVGLGAQKQITENYGVGIEYKLINLPKRSYEFDLVDGNGTKLTSDIKYKIHSIGLRFIYKF